MPAHYHPKPDELGFRKGAFQAFQAFRRQPARAADGFEEMGAE
jgi:hypothetical protein